MTAIDELFSVHTMVDLDLVLKKLAFIETCVCDLRTKANIAVIATDVREERFVIHTLQLAIQAALDSASHIVSDYRQRNQQHLIGQYGLAG